MGVVGTLKEQLENPPPNLLKEGPISCQTEFRIYGGDRECGLESGFTVALGHVRQDFLGLYNKPTASQVPCLSSLPFPED
jgi:hypothetical protein